jgi:hypothetical protein
MHQIGLPLYLQCAVVRRWWLKPVSHYMVYCVPSIANLQVLVHFIYFVECLVVLRISKSIVAVITRFKLSLSLTHARVINFRATFWLLCRVEASNCSGSRVTFYSYNYLQKMFAQFYCVAYYYTTLKFVYIIGPIILFVIVILLAFCS